MTRTNVARQTAHPSAAGMPATLARPAVPRCAQLAGFAVGGFLLPWCVPGVTLPAAVRAQDWPLAWAGLDGAEAVAALATGALAGRADTWAALTAVAGGTLLLAGAWFDVCTSAPGLAHVLAVAEAICVELPLAGAACRFAVTLARSTR